MELKDIMKLNHFVVVGNTIDSTKYAAMIKEGLIKHGYQVDSVYKELKSLDDVPGDIDCIDLCINPVKGIEILKQTSKNYKVVLIQPGAESEEIKKFLEENHKDYLEGCALVGLSLYAKDKING